MLSRKYYRMIAQVIKDSELSYDEIDKATSKGGLIDLLCIALKQDNNRFDETRFVEACMNDW